MAVAVAAYEWWANPLETGEVVTIMPRSAQSEAGEAAPMPAQASDAADALPAPAPASVPKPAAEGAARVAEQRTQVVAPAGAAGARVGGPKRIELEFDQPSWVEIKQANGKILLSQLNQGGTNQVIEGMPPFEVVIGNAASVRLKYNDAPVDLRPYFKVDVARLKLE